jgi:hypothetical protein
LASVRLTQPVVVAVFAHSGFVVFALAFAFPDVCAATAAGVGGMGAGVDDRERARLDAWVGFARPACESSERQWRLMGGETGERVRSRKTVEQRVALPADRRDVTERWRAARGLARVEASVMPRVRVVEVACARGAVRSARATAAASRSAMINADAAFSRSRRPRRSPPRYRPVSLLVGRAPRRPLPPMPPSPFCRRSVRRWRPYHVRHDSAYRITSCPL